METLEFMQKPIELAQSSQPYLRRLWETAAEISKSHAFITSVFSSVLKMLSNFLVQEAILNMAVCQLAFNRLTFTPDYRLSVSAGVQPETGYVPSEPVLPAAPVFNVHLVRKLVADLARRMATQAPRTMVSTRAVKVGEKRTESETTEEPTEQHAEPELMEMPFQTLAEMRDQLALGLAPSIRSFASTLRAYSSYAVSLYPLPRLLGMGSPRPVRQPASVVDAREELPSPESAKPLPTAATQTPKRREEEEGKVLLSKLVTRKSALSEVSSQVKQTFELPAMISQRQPEALSAALSLPSYISNIIEEISPSLASWVYGESEALRSTGLSLSAVPVAASTAQKIVTEALIEPVSGVESPSAFEREAPFRFPSIFTSFVAAHAKTYSPFYAGPSVVEPYPVPDAWEPPYPTQAPKESPLLEEASVSRLPSVIALAAAESLIAQKLQREMTALAKDVQSARSTYMESPTNISNTGSVRTTKLGELATSHNFPVPIEPYVPPVSLTRPQQTKPRLIDHAAQNMINLTVSAESQEEDLRELERKINKILAEQLSRYYGSTRI